MNDSEIVSDPFLSGILERPVFHLRSAIRAIEVRSVCGERGMCYAKIPVDAIRDLSILEENGFRLIDSNVVLERGSLKEGDVLWELDSGYTVGEAQENDREAVESVAESAFDTTRFHLDPAISNRDADRIKKCWAGNFFSGSRGDGMIVARYQEKAVGFLQWLLREDVLTIDLIAVGREHRKRKLGQAMIQLISRIPHEFERIQVGTQLANISSLGLYTKMGFVPCSASYVLHYHGENC